jgi:hypothetical protein
MKKRISVLFAAVLFCVTAFAQPISSKLTVNFKNGKLKVGKKDVAKEWKTNSFLAAFDSASRVQFAKNKVFTYDMLGIVLHEELANKQPTGNILEFQYFLDETEASKFTPKEYYEGKLTIEKMEITRNTTIEDIRKKLDEFKEVAIDEDDKYRFSNDGVYIYFIYNRFGKLAKVTFGKDKLQ